MVISFGDSRHLNYIRSKNLQPRQILAASFARINEKMITSGSFPIIIIAWTFSSARTSVDGSAQSCPRNAIVDLTGTTPDSSGFAEKTDDIFPTNSTWFRDGKKLGCPCIFKTCISLCCHPGMAWLGSNCVEDNETFSSLPKFVTSVDGDGVMEEIPMQDYHLLNDESCSLGWMTSSVIKKFTLLKNGSIYAPDFGGRSLLNFENYCLMREPKSSEYLVNVCRPVITINSYDICCLIIIILIMLVIFIACSISPELKNLHGMIFQSYVATYIMIYVLFLGTIFTMDARANPFWFTFTEIAVRYSCGSCACWLNVMSFNIWRSFRGLQQICRESKEEVRKKFICYAIYAWCSPLVLVLIVIAIITSLPYCRLDKFDEPIKQWCSIVTIVALILFNILLFTLTALSIRRQQKDTAHLAHDMNKHYEVNKQWFILYFKLFLIMGAHMVMWPVWLRWPRAGITHLVITAEVVQGFLVFVVFIWKENVRQSLCNRFYESWIVIRSVRYFNRMPATDT